MKPKIIISTPHLLPTLALGLCFSSIATANNTLAQIIPDNTLGKETSQVNSLDSNTQQIDAGAIRGENLFHSFQEFNIDEGKIVNFSNPEGIAHIFSRVTGNNPSAILGTLGVVGGNADLFLLNPNGIIFGRNSSLNVGGSFVATSASSIHFADGNKFATTNTSDKPLLTISTPIGLEFEL
ncbi:MAG: filamentous hemagglutinin N-terminal domain-containing protein [Xenococcaceae cyanobacterium MO_207.B15]|nr:filamentous hemagglutinin N-terminal domain-containing protein [Xenococcaceae cyanobacterium MO_207.B15]